MLTEADHGSVNRLVVRDHEYARFLDDFETALPLLKAVLELEVRPRVCGCPPFASILECWWRFRLVSSPPPTC